jgi:hypothetical protein
LYNLSGAAKPSKSLSENYPEITDTRNTYNPLQDLGSVRSTSLQLVSLLTIFFNVILLYRTLPIDFSIYAHKQTNKDPLRGTTRLTIILSLSTASHELSGGENPYL